MKPLEFLANSWVGRAAGFTVGAFSLYHLVTDTNIANAEPVVDNNKGVIEDTGTGLGETPYEIVNMRNFEIVQPPLYAQNLGLETMLNAENKTVFHGTWDYSGPEVSEWDIRLRVDNAYDSGYRVAGSLGEFTSNVLTSSGLYEFVIRGLNSEGNPITPDFSWSMQVRYDLPTPTVMPTPIPTDTATPTPTPGAGSLKVYDDLDSLEAVTDSASDPLNMVNDLALRWDTGAYDHYDVHVEVDGEWHYLGKSQIGVFEWSPESLYDIAEEFALGPIAANYRFQVNGVNLDGSYDVLGRSGAIDYSRSAAIPTDTPVPTDTPTETATDTPSPSPSPTPEKVVISGQINWLISEGGYNEGDPVANANVSLINEKYSVSGYMNEPVVGDVAGSDVTDASGNYSISIDKSVADSIQQARLRILGDNVSPMVSGYFDLESGVVPGVEDDPVPGAFNWAAYNWIWRRFKALDFNGENAITQQKLETDENNRCVTPWLILDKPAAYSGYIPTQEEKDVYINVITNELSDATRGLLNMIYDGSENNNVSFLPAPPNPLPDSFIGGSWNDSEGVYGQASSPTTEVGNPHIIKRMMFSVNTLQKIAEKKPNWNEEEVMNRYKTVCEQEIGTMAGAVMPYWSDSPGDLGPNDTIFYEGSTATTFTKFDKDSFYITYVRREIAAPYDFNVSSVKIDLVQQ